MGELVGVAAQTEGCLPQGGWGAEPQLESRRGWEERTYGDSGRGQKVERALNTGSRTPTDSMELVLGGEGRPGLTWE